MPTLIPTAATGARSVPETMTVVDPARTLPPDEQQGFLAGTELNGPFVADLLSDMLAHERCGAQLYRSVAQRTNNPVLEERYKHFGEETSVAIPPTSAPPPAPPRRPAPPCWSRRSCWPARST
jgi:hypothetical protein